MFHSRIVDYANDRLIGMIKIKIKLCGGSSQKRQNLDFNTSYSLLILTKFNKNGEFPSLNFTNRSRTFHSNGGPWSCLQEDDRIGKA